MLIEKAPAKTWKRQRWTSTMDFSEANRQWQRIPKWVDFLIQFGFRWPRRETRRIVLISMPCDSAGAGLIALGAMTRDLANPLANDFDGHASRLAARAEEYLHTCAICDLDKCDPEVRGCGLIRKFSGLLRRSNPASEGIKFQITKLSGYPECPVWIRPTNAHRGGNQCPTLEELREFYIDGEAPMEVAVEGATLDATPYAALIPNNTPLAENLRRSYSGVCLAGRSSGAAPSYAVCESVRFRHNGITYPLHQLLTIREWSASAISRVSFFNPLNDRFDRNGVSPSIIVADGDRSFLKVLSKAEFQNSDVIGVVSRTIERDRLEDVGNKMVQMGTWYSPDEELLYALPPVSPGMSLAAYKRREAA